MKKTFIITIPKQRFVIQNAKNEKHARDIFFGATLDKETNDNPELGDLDWSVEQIDNANWYNASLDIWNIREMIRNKNPKQIPLLLEDIDNLRLTIQCIQDSYDKKKGGGK